MLSFYLFYYFFKYCFVFNGSCSVKGNAWGGLGHLDQKDFQV